MKTNFDELHFPKLLAVKLSSSVTSALEQIYFNFILICSGTDEDVEKLIRLRREKYHLFSGKRFASASGCKLCHIIVKKTSYIDVHS